MSFLSALADPLLALSVPQFGGITPPPDVPTGGLFSTGQDVIRTFLSFFLIIVVVLAILYLLIGALRYIYSRGDKQRIQGAREKITYSIVGLIIAFLAFPLMTIIGKFFNVPLLSPFTVSVSHSCGACTHIDPITVTTRAIDIKYGIKLVFALVDTDGDGTYESVKNCTSSPCVLDVGSLPPGTYKYYGAARNDAPVPQEKSTQPQTFTIIPATCGLLNSCTKCLTKVGCMWARDSSIPGSSLTCYPVTSNPDACEEEFSEMYRASCLVNECGSIPTNTPTPGAPTPTLTGAPTPTRTPTPTGTPSPSPTPGVCSSQCTTDTCALFGGQPGVWQISRTSCGPGCCNEVTICVNSSVCPLPTSTPSPTPTPVPTSTPAPTPTIAPVNLPDLQIWAFGFIPFFPSVGENVIFTVSVANFGGSIAPDTKVRLYEGISEPSCGDQEWFGEASIVSLVPFSQDTKIVVKLNGFPASGTYRVWAFANAECRVDESNEANNAASIFILVL